MMCNSSMDVLDQENPHASNFWRGVVMSDPGAGVLIVDSQGTICATNDAGAAFLGFASPQEAVGKKPDDLVPPKAATERLKILRRVLQTGNPIIVHEMWDGVRARTQVFPMATPLDGQQRALVIIRGQVAMPRRAQSKTIKNQTFEVLEAEHQDMGPLENLTTREIEVLGLIGRGLTTAQIAKYIHRSVKTVEWHRSALGEKLNVKNRVQLAAMAIKAGLVEKSRESHPPASSN